MEAKNNDEITLINLKKMSIQVPPVNYNTQKEERSKGSIKRIIGCVLSAATLITLGFTAGINVDPNTVGGDLLGTTTNQEAENIDALNQEFNDLVINNTRGHWSDEEHRFIKEYIATDTIASSILEKNYDPNVSMYLIAQNLYPEDIAPAMNGIYADIQKLMQKSSELFSQELWQIFQYENYDEYLKTLINIYNKDDAKEDALENYKLNMDLIVKATANNETELAGSLLSTIYNKLDEPNLTGGSR